ncbi:uncharacterized protein [Nicotiana tomentosiformis]|uniref:uncharacterized protein n=1 Tax=Nicotiana tomentosiformis TaxID=4098 RepID=UPI00388C45C3
MSSPLSFAAWGMDMIGPIEPAASNGHHFIFVAIDYFTKWVEASTYKGVTKKVMVDFVRNNIVHKFGITKSIITDNAANINSDLMREIHNRPPQLHSLQTANKWGSRGSQQEYQEDSAKDSGQSQTMARETTFCFIGLSD